ncbi:hypothetical protein Q8G35_19775 [Peribacillus simplex]|uniref:Uncharacterized protein n=2 Tax=Peribacillus TaxID=2675229 RepID=A0AA90P6X5_9BACI|nr:MULTISPECIES: hypothetical protein [Peribacillus]MDP1420558.1 hypothetical protein [Peribacillus simplex]MDP1453316.1 hypothetical protein [Peribacillus frigoritolerans]
MGAWPKNNLFNLNGYICIQGENINVTFMFAPICPAGCWSSIELNELAIVTALGIDKTEGGYQFEDLEVNVTVKEDLQFRHHNRILSKRSQGVKINVGNHWNSVYWSNYFIF